jgi:Uncharacterized protein conserved in archaea
MALINCPECGRINVSDTAEICPDCGFGIKSYFEKIKAEEQEHIRLEQENIKKIQIEKEKEETLNNERRKTINQIKEESLPNKPLLKEQFNIKKVSVLVFILLLGLFGIRQVVTGNAEDGALKYVIGTFIVLLILVMLVISDYFSKIKKYNNKVINFEKEKERKITEINQYYNNKDYYDKKKAEEIAKAQAIKNLQNITRCPRCGSTNIQIVKRGWRITTGFIGSGKNERVCVNCMKKF